MPQINNQSEQSKAIKRINERIKELTKLQKFENPYLSPYSNAIRTVGMDFVKRDGQYIIRNTAENRKKVGKLEERLKRLNAKTVSRIKKEVKRDLQTEAEELARKIPKSERKKFIKEYTSKLKQQERLLEKVQDETIYDMLQFLYVVDPEVGNALGRELSALTSGKSRPSQDRGAIYDLFGRIRKAKREALLKSVAGMEQQRDIDLENLYRTFGEWE